MGINLFYICKYTFFALLNTGELLTCMELCHFSEHKVLNYLMFFDKRIQHYRKWEENVIYLLVIMCFRLEFFLGFLSESTWRNFFVLFAMKPVWQMTRKRNMKLCLLILIQTLINSVSLLARSLLGTSLLRVFRERWRILCLDKSSKCIKAELFCFFSLVFKMQ